MRLRNISRNVVMLGLVSLCNDLATEMLYPIIPLFVIGALGSSPAILGVIEGVAEGISSGLRWVGGAWSDRLGRRKPFVVAGYGLSALSRPVMGAAAFVLGWPLFLVGRSSDRLGKAVRTAARDALIADSSPNDARGLAFGFHRTCDTFGAVLGPLVALLVLKLWPSLPLATLFFIALVPALGSVLIAAIFVREVSPQNDDATPPQEAGSTPQATARLRDLPRGFWMFLAAYALFSLGNSSDSFLLLRARDIGLSLDRVILVYALFNVVYALCATPFGRLSDRIGRRPVLAAGWLVYAGVYVGFAVWGAAAAPWVLMAAYGLYHALTEGVTKALVTDFVPAGQRGGALGLFLAVAGVSQVVASLAAGALWNVRPFGTAVVLPLALGAVLSLAAIPLLLAARPARQGD